MAFWLNVEFKLPKYNKPKITWLINFLLRMRISITMCCWNKWSQAFKYDFSLNHLLSNLMRIVILKERGGLKKKYCMKTCLEMISFWHF